MKNAIHKTTSIIGEIVAPLTFLSNIRALPKICGPYPDFVLCRHANEHYVAILSVTPWPISMHYEYYSSLQFYIFNMNHCSPRNQYVTR